MRFERRSRTTYRPTVSPSRSTHVDSFTGTTSSITVARTRQEYQPTRYRGVARWGEPLERMPVNDRLAAGVEYRVVVGMLDLLTELERRLDDGCPASRNCSQPTCTGCSATETPSPGARQSSRCTPKTSCSATRRARSGAIGRRRQSSSSPRWCPRGRRICRRWRAIRRRRHRSARVGIRPG